MVIFHTYVSLPEGISSGFLPATLFLLMMADDEEHHIKHTLRWINIDPARYGLED